MARKPWQQFAIDNNGLIYEFSKLVHEKFPTEIRLIIYSFIWDDDFNQVDIRARAARRKIINPIYPDLAEELIRSYYESERVFTIDCPEMTGKILRRDEFGAGIVPAHCSLRNIKICIAVPYIRNLPEETDEAFKAVLEDFKPLINQNYGPHATVGIVVRPVKERLIAIHWLHKIGKYLAPVIDEISKNGVKVSLVYSTRWFEKDVLGLAGGSREAWYDINKYGAIRNQRRSIRWDFFTALYNVMHEDLHLAEEYDELIPPF